MKLRLSALQLKILRSLCFKEYKNIDELAKGLNKSPSRVSVALKDLADKGFIETRKIGLSKQIVLSDNKHSSLLKTFISEYHHMKFEELLSGSTLEILLPITYSKVKFADIVRLSGCSERTVRRTMKKLKEFGMVTMDREFYYSIGPLHGLLSDFVKEFQSYLNIKSALSFSRTSVIPWQRGKEFLVKTSEEEKRRKWVFSTCYEKMYGYGVQLVLTNFRYYFYSPFKKHLKVEDVALHTLILDPTSSRNILYVLLLITKSKKFNV